MLIYRKCKHIQEYDELKYDKEKKFYNKQYM